MNEPTRFRRLWLTPLVLAALTAAGLVSALVGDDAWDAVSWFALAAPHLASVWILARRPSGSCQFTPPGES